MKNWSIKVEKNSNGYEAMRDRIKRQGGQCSKCPSVNNITVDHIIPRSFLVVLGFNDAYKDLDNLQLLCKRCNSLKSNTLDYTNPKTLPLLNKYIDMWVEKHNELALERITHKLTARCLCCLVDEKA
jgi:5-methylcytosine-specific restriction endonuclease McrA